MFPGVTISPLTFKDPVTVKVLLLYTKLAEAVAAFTEPSDKIILPGPGSCIVSNPVPEEPAVPLVPVVPDVPEVPLVPVVPDVPEVPLVPVVPEEPAVPLVPVVPLVPLDPLVPEDPTPPDKVY
jgi:hypothetical protein